jgi:hypothetical protein
MNCLKSAEMNRRNTFVSETGSIAKMHLRPDGLYIRAKEVTHTRGKI